MRIYSKLALAGLAAIAAFSVAVGAANARSLRVSEQNFEDIWTKVGLSAAGTTVGCPVTLLGHFEERTFAKVVGATVGIYRHVEIGTCTGGAVTVLIGSLPWRISYQGFSGTLPRMTQIRFLLIGISIQVHPEGSAECLARTTAEHPAFGEAALSAGGDISGFRLDEGARIPLGGGFICSLAGEASIEGTAEVRNLPRLGALNVTLI